MEDDASNTKKKDVWDKLQVAAIALGALAVPVILSIFGHMISINIKAQDASTEMIRLSVDILKSVPKDEEDEPIREWAIAILDKHSGVSIADPAKRALSSGPLLSEDVSGIGLMYECKASRASVYPSDHGFIPNMARIVSRIRAIEANGKCLVGEEIDAGMNVEEIIVRDLNSERNYRSSDLNPFMPVLRKPCQKHHFYVYVSIIDALDAIENDQECVAFITMD